MLLQSTGNCWIVAAFYLNRNYIARTLCINRLDKIPVCKGACFLERKLNENDKRQERSPESKYKEIILFCQSFTYLPDNILSPENDHSFNAYRSPYRSSLLIKHIFKPPAYKA